ncbi:MAG: response regulator [Micrococcaceae bacterium]
MTEETRPAESGEAATSETIRLLLADDQHLVRAGLAALLNLENDLDVVHQQSSGEGILEAVRDHRVDVAVLDIEMPGMDGITATQTLIDSLERPPAVLILTTFGRTGYLQRAMAAGASGFMVKDAPAEQLAQAIRTVHAGGRAVDPSLAAEALSIPASPLTEREGDVLRVALTGASVKSIAAELFLSPGTVRNHLSAAIGKTGTTNRAEAARLAHTHGWL